MRSIRRALALKLPVLSRLSLAALAATAAAATVVGCSAGASGVDSSRDALSASQCASAQAWAANVAYATGAVVTFGGNVYECIQGHTSQSSWTPDATPALWAPASCAGGTVGGSSGGSTGTSSGAPSCGSSSGGVSTGGAPDAGTGTGTGSSSGGSTSGSSSGSSGGGTSSGGAGSGGSTGKAPAGLVFSAYKDTSINMNWNTNVISTSVSGAATPLATDLSGAGGKTITLAFATGECGSENWGGVQGAAMASANVPLLTAAGVNYILSTGGAAGSFTCGSDAGFTTFVGRWASANLIGVDFDIEAGQTTSVIGDLISRIKAAHGTYPNLRFSLTLATLANNNGASTAQSLGASAPDSFNVYGDETLDAVKSTLGFSGPSSWPSYVTVDLMTMDFGSASAGVCVVSSGSCDMGQSALQAAYNLHDHWGVPFANIELTPMIGQNDASSEQFTLENADTVAKFAIDNGLGGVHYWSYDRDTDSPAGSASPTGNSMGSGYAGARGFMKRFIAAGL
jgi:chitinase